MGIDLGIGSSRNWISIRVSNTARKFAATIATKSPRVMRMAVDIATIERDENEVITAREAVPP